MPAITAAFKNTSSISWASPSSESRYASRHWLSSGDDAYLRGTALEYLEAVLPARIFALLGPRLAVKSTPARKRGDPVTVRAQLLDAAASMKPARDQVGPQLAGDLDDEG